METPTLELRPLREENGAIPPAEDRSCSPYLKSPSPLPPYSDMDRNLVISESNGNSHKASKTASGSDNNSETEARDTPMPATNDETSPALSAFYAQVVFLGATVLVFTEVLQGPIPLLFFHGYVFTYLLGGSILIFLCTYLRLLMKKCQFSTNRERDTNREQLTTPFMRNLLNSDVSIYYRMGAVVFGCGTLVSCGMEVVSLFTMTSDCMDDLNFTEAILRALFSCLQMHFLFMNSAIIINALGWFRHVALMHLIATNLSVWMNLVLWEGARDWLDATHVKHNSSMAWPSKEFGITVHTIESDNESPDVIKHVPVHNTYFTTNCYWRETEDIEGTEDLLALQLCLQNSTAGFVWKLAKPFLYPFIVQYSITAAIIIYILWSKFQLPYCRLKKVTVVPAHEERPEEQKTNCTGYRTGLVLGLLVLTSGVISLIVLFLLAEHKHFGNFLYLLITILRCVVLGVSTFAAILGIAQIKKMRSETRRRYMLMEVLQRIGLFGVYLFAIFSMIVGGVSITRTRHLLLFLDGMLMVVQAFLQTVFIHQVTRKRLGLSNVGYRPGRSVVMFLVLTNVTLCLLESLTTQNHENLLQLQFYGAIAWPLLWRTLLPLVTFYRFHSAVSLLEAWKRSYKIKKK